MVAAMAAAAAAASKKEEDPLLEEDDFDNDLQQEESHRFNKFKNGQYFWMSITRKFDIVIFRVKKFVVEQLKQPDYREDVLAQEINVLEYLAVFAKKLLKSLKEKSHRQEKLIQHSSPSNSGIFGLFFIQSSSSFSSLNRNIKAGRSGRTASSIMEDDDEDNEEGGGCLYDDNNITQQNQQLARIDSRRLSDNFD